MYRTVGRITIRIAAAVLLVASTGQAQTITTVAGNGTAGSCGDGGPATSACLNYPTGVAAGADGALFIADYYNHRVRKVDPGGTITTVAGGTAGFCGDGGPATGACLNYPTGVAVDAAGTLYIADQANGRIRKVDTAGTITTVAGRGLGTFCGDGGAATSACISNPTGVAVDAAGALFIADYGNNRIRKVNAAGTITTVAGGGSGDVCGDGGPAVGACLLSPSSVAVGADGALFIAQYVSHRIRHVDAAGTISTVAGNGVADFCGDGGPATSACIRNPWAVALDASGTLFIADSSNRRIRQVDAAGTIATVAGSGASGFCGDGGPATSACLSSQGVAVDAAGSLYIVDRFNNRIRRVVGLAALTLYKTALPPTYNAVGQTISYSYVLTNSGRLAVSGPFAVSDDRATDENCPATVFLAPAASITCTASDTITQADLDAGSVTNIATATNGTTTSNTASATVTAIQTRALTILKTAMPTTFTAAGQPIGYSYVVTSSGNVTLSGPFTVTDDKVTVACPATSTLAPGEAITCTASYATTAADLTAGSVVNVAAASNGVVTSPTDTATVIAVLTPRTISTIAGVGSVGFCGDNGPATGACLGYPYGLALGSAGTLFITMPNDHRVRKVSATGTITTAAGNGTAGFCGDGGPAVSACLNAPAGAAADAAGTLLIADSANHRIRRVAAGGRISTVAGNGTPGFCGDGGPATSACLHHPEGVAVGPDGTVFIADRANHRIRKVSATGTITTVAGNGTAGYCGDGGPATDACLDLPTSVAVGAGGALFIADYANHRVRKVDAGGTITTVAGAGTASFCGDAGPAASACLNSPVGVAVSADGALFIADYYNERIRKVDAAGTITTVAGTGTASFCGDGGPATSACLWHPVGVTVTSGGALLIADHLNHRVRKVGSTIASVTLSKTLISGCLKTTAKVTLSAPAPAGGLVLTLASDNVHAAVPASLTIKAGVTLKSFPVVTSPVAVNETATISASTGGVTGAATLTLKPMGPKSVSLVPNPVVGGHPATGTVMLECAAGPGDIVVALSSSKPATAWPTTPTATVPSGTKTAEFTVMTGPTTEVKKATIKATANGMTKSKTLTVN
jgi:sugar lactone lactonase YvrE